MEHISRFLSVYDLQNDARTHDLLGEMSSVFSTIKDETIILDFSKVSFVSANLFAILGGIIETYKDMNRIKVGMYKVSDKIKTIMRKNRFGSLLNWDMLADTYNTTIPYKKFSRNQIDEFEKYVLLNILNRSNMPDMSPLLKSAILDNFLEIYNNVIDHTSSEYIFTCGQYFPNKSNLLYFSIVDIGETIYQNVMEYHNKNFRLPPYNALKWAMKRGNSTRILSSPEPGGLGFSMILDFIKMNHGCFYVVSDREAYEYNERGERFIDTEHAFKGTIVTMAFNLGDTCSYELKSEQTKEKLIF